MLLLNMTFSFIDLLVLPLPYAFSGSGESVSSLSTSFIGFLNDYPVDIFESLPPVMPN
jgi:hypothetical protein